MIETPQGTIQKVVEGAGLKSMMIPDPVLPGNRPRHIECYRFPHMLVKDDRIWAMTRHTHVVEREPAGNNYIVGGFGYSIGMHNIFYTLSNNGPNSGVISWMPMSRYEKFQWMAEEVWRVAWDSEKPQDIERLRKAVSEGCSMKIHLLDEEDYWNIHPVEGVRIEDSGSFKIKTEPVNYPMPIRTETETGNLFSEIKRRFEGDEVMLKGECQHYTAYYALQPDGSYYNYYDVFRQSAKKYKRLIVFSEKLDD